MDKRQKSRRKTIKAVDKEGLEEEIDKKRAAEREEDEKKQKEETENANQGENSDVTDSLAKIEREKKERFEKEQMAIKKEYEEQKFEMEMKLQQETNNNDHIKQEMARKNEIERIDKERKELLNKEEEKNVEAGKIKKEAMLQAELDQKKRDEETAKLEINIAENKMKADAAEKTQESSKNDNAMDSKKSDNNTGGETGKIQEPEQNKNYSDAKKDQKESTDNKETEDNKITGLIKEEEERVRLKSESDRNRANSENIKDEIAKKIERENALRTDQMSEVEKKKDEDEKLQQEKNAFIENERLRIDPPQESKPSEINSKEVPDDDMLDATSGNKNENQPLDSEKDKTEKGGDPSNTMDKRVKINEDKNEEKELPENTGEGKSGTNGNDSKPLVDITNKEGKDKAKPNDGDAKDKRTPMNEADKPMVGPTNNRKPNGAEGMGAASTASGPNGSKDGEGEAQEEKKKQKHNEVIKTEESKAQASTDKQAYLAAGLIPPSQASGKKLKPITDEDVDKDGQHAGQGLHVDTTNIKSDSEIGKARADNQVIYEGTVFKRKFFFSCCWHERYFVLTKDGILRYYRDKNKGGKGDINIATIRDLHRLDELGKKHPYKIMLRYLDREDLMAFDEEPERNRWAAKLGEARRNLL